MEKKYEIIDRVIEIEVYLYILFMFLTKGEGIRNTLLYSGFFLWLATLKYRNDKWIITRPVPLLFWGFMATVLLSAVFSIDPLYSLKAIREDALKATAIFCLVSTVLSDEKRLERFTYLTLLLLVFTISVGYYSYIVYDMPLMKPNTTIRHAWHAQFAVDLNTLLSFSFVLFLISKDTRLKILVAAAMVAGISGVILSTSRGGLAGSMCIASVWMIFYLRTKKVNFKLVAAAALIVVLFFGAALYVSPLMKDKFIYDKKGIMSLNERTDIWKPLIAAALQRPVLGWGYGPKIFTLDKPFEHTQYKVAPVNIKPAFRNPHNPFLRVLFHQGVIGLILYVMLLFAATGIYWRAAVNTDHIKSYILTACASIMIGTFLINAIVENSHLTELALVLGTGLAAYNLKNEDSRT